jgi:hypothetical protein
MEIASTGNMLITRKKAPYREIADPGHVFRYILMWRTRITRDAQHVPVAKVVHWERWLADRKHEKEIGWEVERLLGKATREIHRTNEDLLERMKSYDEVIALLKELGLDQVHHKWIKEQLMKKYLNADERQQVRDTLARLLEVTDQEHERRRHHLQQSLAQFIKDDEGGDR